MTLFLLIRINKDHILITIQSWCSFSTYRFLIWLLTLDISTTRIHLSFIYAPVMKIWKLLKRNGNQLIPMIPTNTKLVVSFLLYKLLLLILNSVVLVLVLPIVQWFLNVQIIYFLGLQVILLYSLDLMNVVISIHVVWILLIMVLMTMTTIQLFLMMLGVLMILYVGSGGLYQE